MAIVNEPQVDGREVTDLDGEAFTTETGVTARIASLLKELRTRHRSLDSVSVGVRENNAMTADIQICLQSRPGQGFNTEYTIWRNCQEEREALALADAFVRKQLALELQGAADPVAFHAELSNLDFILKRATEW